MILRRGTQRSGALAFLTGLLLIVATATESAAADGKKYAAQRVDLGRARPVTRKVKKRTSLVAQAARGQALAEIPPQPLNGTLVPGNVRRVGFLDDYRGPAASCGCGEAICDCGEAVCGIEPSCGIPLGCDCGLGGACGCEAVCGVETIVQPSCGFGVGPGCGIEGCDTCGEAVCGVEVVGDCGCDACCSPGIPLCLPFLRLDWRRFEFFVGTQGFKGPANFASINAADPTQHIGSGSFGFYEGFNEGRSLNRWLGADLAAQFGLRATQSSLSGTDFTTKTRNQIFLTGGLFRRVDFGLQYGLVVDYLSDDWFYQADLVQLRGEFSWNNGCQNTWGFQYMVGTSGSTATTTASDLGGNVVQTSVRFEATDQYRFFLRREFKCNSSCSGFAGWTKNDDGLIGSSLDLALCRQASLNCGATYLIPSQGTGSGGNQEESWNIAIGITYRPGGSVTCGRYCRPMFDVADNGTFMVDRF